MCWGPSSLTAGALQVHVAADQTWTKSVRVRSNAEAKGGQIGGTVGLAVGVEHQLPPPIGACLHSAAHT